MGMVDRRLLFCGRNVPPPQGANFPSFTQALKAGNPQALVAFNPGQLVPLICHSENEDYTAGEISVNYPLCPGRWVERHHHAVQWHVYTWIGPDWGGGDEPRLPLEFVIGYTKHSAAHQGVVTWDVPCQGTGLIKDVYLRMLESLAKEVPPEKAR
jgi:hypothetical protein